MTKRKSRVISADCPECSHPIYFQSSPSMGRVFECPMCSEKLEVVSRVPLILDWALDEYEDEYDVVDAGYDTEYENDRYEWDD